MARKIFCFFAFAALLAPSFVFAQPRIPDANLTYGSVASIIGTIANWIFGIFLAVSIIYILWAAYLYLSSEEKNIVEARSRIIAAAVAIAIALLAKGVGVLVGSLLGVGPGGAGVIQQLPSELQGSFNGSGNGFGGNNARPNFGQPLGPGQGVDTTPLPVTPNPFPPPQNPLEPPPTLPA